MRKLYLVVIVLIAASMQLQSFAQQVIDSTKLTLDRIFNSDEFQQEYSAPIKWLGTGDFYTTLEKSDSLKGGRDLVKYNTISGDKSIMVNAKKFIPEGSDKPLRFSGYTWSEDLTKLLLFTNTKRVWRANTRGDYWVYDLKTGKAFPVGSRPA